jgi:hypothetical protein
VLLHALPVGGPEPLLQARAVFQDSARILARPKRPRVKSVKPFPKPCRDVRAKARCYGARRRKLRPIARIVEKGFVGQRVQEGNDVGFVCPSLVGVFSEWH